MLSDTHTSVLVYYHSPSLPDLIEKEEELGSQGFLTCDVFSRTSRERPIPWTVTRSGDM